MSASKIPDGPEWQYVRDMFAMYHLNPNNPEDVLIFLKALVDFVQQRGGRTKKWTDDKLLTLAADVERIRRERPKASELDICTVLLKRGGYRDEKPTTLLRRLYDSRNPARNRFLGLLLNTLVTEHGGDPGRWLAWLTRGSTDVFEDTSGEIHASPPPIKLVRE